MIRKTLIAATMLLGLGAVSANAGVTGYAGGPILEGGQDVSHYQLKCHVVPVKKVVWQYGYKKIIWVNKKVCKKVYYKHYKKYGY
jgi:hypothetical protein